jgi:hypothetical protein
MSGFRSTSTATRKAIEDIYDRLGQIDPNDIVGVARLQGELSICKARQAEYDICEKKVFDLEHVVAGAVKRRHETGIVPPKEGE